jgi:hypothetical protein
MERNPTATETISAEQFAEMMRVGGTDLRKLGRVPVPRARRTVSGGYDPDDPTLRHAVDHAEGRFRACAAGGRVATVSQARIVEGWSPVFVGSDGSASLVVHYTPDVARRIARQLLHAADEAERGSS